MPCQAFKCTRLCHVCLTQKFLPEFEQFFLGACLLSLGAELANLCREAALAAVRENMEDAREVAGGCVVDHGVLCVQCLFVAVHVTAL